MLVLTNHNPWSPPGCNIKFLIVIQVRMLDAYALRILSDLETARSVYERCHTVIPLRAKANLTKMHIIEISKPALIVL